MSLKVLAAALALTCAAAPAAAQNRPNQARDMMRELHMGGLEGAKLAKAIARAEASPLGSKANPVRENMPRGEYAYLHRLRCPDGQAPSATRVGNVGTGVYGNIVDLFQVACPGARPVEVYIDMYHDGPETRPVPGFTIEPPPTA
ncbi:MAG: hypothetical protein JO013_05565 [Alphaproteobacteria bacterium]|nr:hypothetical protein [Alphaproteobacteria bacterium]